MRVTYPNIYVDFPYLLILTETGRHFFHREKTSWDCQSLEKLIGNRCSRESKKKKKQEKKKKNNVTVDFLSTASFSLTWVGSM